MYVEEALFKLLRDNAAVSAIVMTRIYPIVLDRNVIYPAIVYRELHGSADEHEETLDGSAGLRHSRFGIYSTQSLDEEALDESPYLTVLRLAETIRLALQGFTGTVYSDDSPPEAIFIGNISAGAHEDRYDDPTQTFQRLQIYEIWSEEQIPTFP